MEIIRGVEEIDRSFKNPFVTLGNFDGVHLGHQNIFKNVLEQASKIQGEGIVITFEPHPLKVLSPTHCPLLLTPFRKKMMLIEQSRIETVLCLNFTLAFSQLSPLEFVEGILIKKVNPRKIIVGYNYHFGQKKKGDAKALRTICKPFHIDVEIVGPFIIDGVAVSSSRIRGLIKEGKMEEAGRLLGRDYLVMGRVIEGSKRGKELGFPTANLEISEELYPPFGVYAVEVIWNRRSYQGVANIGLNPTFQVNRSQAPFSLEVHILNFNQMIYGEEIEIHFKQKVRDEIRFESASQLIEQIRKDVEWAQRNVFRRTP